jgi:hypothetical protein
MAAIMRVVREAPAEHGRHRLVNLFVGRLRILVEKRLGGENHAVEAEAALRGLRVDEGFWMGCGFSGVPSPSSVTIVAPLTVLTGVRQLRTARPLTMAVQEPHWPSPHPNFGPFRARSSLRT